MQENKAKLSEFHLLDGMKRAPFEGAVVLGRRAHGKTLGGSSCLSAEHFIAKATIAIAILISRKPNLR